MATRTEGEGGMPPHQHHTPTRVQCSSTKGEMEWGLAKPVARNSYQGELDR